MKPQTRARPSVEPNVLDLLVQHQHKSLLTQLPLVQVRHVTCDV